MTWQEALQEAVIERNLAEHAFMQSDPDFCDYHIYQLHAAEEKVRLIIRQAREAMGYHPALPPSLSAALMTPASVYEGTSEEDET
ncbi:MAG: hypothetical protein C7B44_09235 [Sulfobacillus thermosulfidooxidans]|uniref:HEPN domain-containing protein n=1 Tax=Sulfobacillus thermotolerans TaxID=338644 RepID=A0ABM6RPE3_9FIRM|nr:hypothetical protein [Sulfobacillus sp. hq2]AUW93229.1 hypothetical protein BXT84_04055 [Sulfobacillus thermotolerans]MCY0906877.1 hypothetical protein [Sulfobacillus thermotolerans]POB11692.1 hypothetical protein CO251_03745 [Sulfobacillus sp. hq2]PSR36398.1 MAG: hypothetical protein C7B44_09235 [Sulfobacillus thermosulfidooxidans]